MKYAPYFRRTGKCGLASRSKRNPKQKGSAGAPYVHHQSLSTSTYSPTWPLIHSTITLPAPEPRLSLLAASAAMHDILSTASEKVPGVARRSKGTVIAALRPHAAQGRRRARRSIARTQCTRPSWVPQLAGRSGCACARQIASGLCSWLNNISAYLPSPCTFSLSRIDLVPRENAYARPKHLRATTPTPPSRSGVGTSA